MRFRSLSGSMSFSRLLSLERLEQALGEIAVKAGLVSREDATILIFRVMPRPVKLKPNLVQYFVGGHGLIGTRGPVARL